MSNKVKTHLIAFAACLFLALAGFTAAGKLDWLPKWRATKDLPIYKTRPIKFSHKNHAGEQQLECDGCHPTALTGDKAGMPPLAICQNCHDSDEDTLKKLKPFMVKDQPVWTTVTAINPDVNFSHKKHVDKQLKCVDCHKGIMESKGISTQVRVDKDTCLACHATKKVSVECKTCHQTIAQSWKPPTHNAAWNRSHGQVVRTDRQMPYSNRCSLCHQDSACAKCHQDEPPQNHNDQWRERTHGIVAGMDREKCAVCHKADYCDRCHQSTTPKSHRAGWGEPRNRHCLTCHTSLSAEGCFTCHHRIPGHLAAPDPPNNVTHNNASEGDCRICHSVSPPHLDNGDNCRSCHR